jgi:hypothetical protein
LDEFGSRSKRPFEIEVDPQRLRSNSVAVTSMVSLLLNLLAVSFTNAKALGRISSK